MRGYSFQMFININAYPIPFLGFLKDVTGMYDYTFVFGGSILALASLFLEIVICLGWQSDTMEDTVGETDS